MICKLFLFVACFLPQSDELLLKFNAKLNDGTSVSGQVDQEIRLETTFGYSVFRCNQIRGITQKDGEFTIRTESGDSIVGKIEETKLLITEGDSKKEIPFADIKSVSVVAQAKLVPGEITDGFATNEVSYHVRVPKGFDPEEKWDAILILHGSNMNSKAYVNTIASVWPSIASRYVLIGVNGENKSRNFNPKSPSFNYTYVQFVGKSTYKGYPGTDRESPALVSEVVTEIKEFIPIKRLFVGGHSQGGYLTYSMMMNYPDLFDGAFPIAGGMIFQVAPTAYDKEDLRKQQREIPLAIVHATNDRVVGFGLSKSAHEAFRDDGFPMLRFVTSETAGHSFAALPIDDAILWLEGMTSNSADEVVKFASELFKAEKFRDVVGLLNKTNLPELSPQQAKTMADFRSQLEDKAGAASENLLAAIEKNENGDWTEDFYEFRNVFEFTETAKPILAAFRKIKAEHEEPSVKLYGEIRRLFQQQKQDEAYAKCEKLVEEYYASSKYNTVKGWLENRK